MAKRVSDLVRKISDDELKDPPSEEWVCVVCGHHNQNWMMNWKYVFRQSNQMWVHGPCTACEEKQQAEQLKKEAEEQRLKALTERKQLSKALASEYPLPVDLLDVELTHLKVEPGSEHAFRVMQNAENVGGWIYIHGQGNTGKSMLMAATYKNLVRKGIPCLFINEGDFFARISAVWDNENMDSNHKIQKLFSRPEIVFWDDFALGFYALNPKREGRKLEWLYFVFNTLSARHAKVILSSNVSPAPRKGMKFGYLGPRVGTRVISRLVRNKIQFVKMNNQPFFTFGEDSGIK